MTDSLSDVIAPLLNKLSPVHRKIILRKIITQLRDSNQQRIKAQENPDGSAFAPRKVQPEVKGLRNKRGPMFTKLRLNKHLRLQLYTNEATVGFSGRAGIIAQQHQEGSPDTSNRFPMPTTQRQLLGITANDEQQILSIVFDELSAP